MNKSRIFSHDKLLSALYFVFDLMSRANLPFFLLDETAYAARYSKKLMGNKITIGIRRVDFQKSSLSILEAFKKADEIGKNFVSYTYEDVPILVKVINDKDGMFTSTDSIVYQYEWFKIPNPFDKYWKQRAQYA